MIRLFSIIAVLLIPLSTSSAETIYKSVDANGKITYSSTPPKDSVNTTKVHIIPAPSQARIEAAQQRHESNIKTARLLDENRKTRNQIVEEENRIKREKQKQLQKDVPRENSDNNTYPYYLPRYPGVMVPPRRPGIDRPVNLPARPR